jgi:2'-hydroxyisoflavone reductase
MRVLIIGGTVFVGRAVAEAALARGDEVTVFHRGLHGAGLLGDRVETVRGDRTTGDLDRLRGRRFDVVVDTCGFRPEDVARSAAAVDAGRYVFVSTAGVYADWPLRPVPDEDAPLHTTGDGYSELKAACERALGPGAAIVRPGTIVGPHENIGRLPHWLWRMGRGGDVLAPGTPGAGIQLIDVRDLAEFCLDCEPGAWNTVSRPDAWSWGTFLETAREVAGAPRTRLRWTDARRVLERVPDPWGVLPLWPAPLDDMAAVFQVGVERAHAAGLTIRPLEDTMADTWAWLSEGGDLGDWRREVQVTGLDPEVEAALLAGVGLFDGQRTRDRG